MRYFVYKKYIKVFRYIRNQDNFYKGFVLEDKFGKRGVEAKSILESRGGIINRINSWDKNLCVIDLIIIEYENKLSQMRFNGVSIIIGLCTLAVTIITLYYTIYKNS